MTGIRETDIQSAILEYLDAHPAVSFAWRQNTGAVTHEDEGRRTRHVRFAFKGCSDILGMMEGGRFLAVEVKTPSSMPTERLIELARERLVSGDVRLSTRLRRLLEQDAFLRRVRRDGGIGLFACNVEHVEAALDYGVEAIMPPADLQEAARRAVGVRRSGRWERLPEGLEHRARDQGKGRS